MNCWTRRAAVHQDNGHWFMKSALVCKESYIPNIDFIADITAASAANNSALRTGVGVPSSDYVGVFHTGKVA
jgi:hypothetical protein